MSRLASIYKNPLPPYVGFFCQRQPMCSGILQALGDLSLQADTFQRLFLRRDSRIDKSYRRSEREGGIDFSVKAYDGDLPLIPTCLMNPVLRNWSIS